MASERAIEKDLNELRYILSDPLILPTKLDVFIDEPIVRKLLAKGGRTVQRILNFLENAQCLDLERVAVVLLSRFPSPTFYPTLLEILAKADRLRTETFEPGLWLIQLPEQQIAHDLVSLVTSTGNPNPLLLLQRPIAQVTRPQLAGFIQQRKLPLSLYALYCYGYTLKPEDLSLLEDVSEWIDIPEMSALGGLYLLKLGSKAGLQGIRAGLQASDESLRKLTYYELADYLPKSSIDHSGYDPGKPGDTQQAAVDILIENLL